MGEIDLGWCLQQVRAIGQAAQEVRASAPLLGVVQAYCLLDMARSLQALKDEVAGLRDAVERLEGHAGEQGQWAEQMAGLGSDVVAALEGVASQMSSSQGSGWAERG